MVKSGAVLSAVPSANGSAPVVTPKTGTQTWTENGLTITVTTNVRQLSPGEQAKLIQGLRK